MELNRRHFLKLAGLTLATLWTGAWRRARVAAPRGLRAVTGGRFPGRVRPRDARLVSGPGPWAG